MHVISMQSSVRRGYVGNAIAAPVLACSGAPAHAVNTVMYEHHPGHGPVTPDITDADELAAMLDTALGECHGPACLLTGYLANADQGRAARAFVEKARTSGKLESWYLDPVFGDDAEGVYVDPAILAFFRDEAIPAASCVLPNRFELCALSGMEISDVDDAVRAAQSLIARGPAVILVSSIPSPDGRLANVLVTETESWAAVVEGRRLRAKGTGDMLSAAFVGAISAGAAATDALEFAVDLVATAVTDASTRDLAELDPANALNSIDFDPVSAKEYTYIAQLDRMPTK